MLTYKNHALDDFLQHCVEGQYTKTMARVGRNSADSAELQACNLRSLRKKLAKTADQDCFCGVVAVAQ